MKLCMPTTNEAGFAGRLSTHFGRASYFTVVETGSDGVIVLENPRAAHEEGRCDAVEVLNGLAIEAVICRGLGRRVLAQMRTRGIVVLLTEAETVGDAVQAFLRGRLSPVTSEEACHGRGHGPADATAMSAQ